MSNITKLDTSTKPAAGTDAVKTHLTINWEGMEQADLIALAQQTIVIKVQAAWRRQEGAIPTEATINATDFKVGVRKVKAPVDLLELAKKMSPEQKAELLKQLQA